MMDENLKTIHKPECLRGSGPDLLNNMVDKNKIHLTMEISNATHSEANKSYLECSPNLKFDDISILNTKKKSLQNMTIE